MHWILNPGCKERFGLIKINPGKLVNMRVKSQENCDNKFSHWHKKLVNKECVSVQRDN